MDPVTHGLASYALARAAFPRASRTTLVAVVLAGTVADLDRLTATAQGILARSCYSFASIALQASIGPSLFFAGRTDAAMRALEKGLTLE